MGPSTDVIGQCSGPIREACVSVLVPLAIIVIGVPTSERESVGCEADE